MNLIRKHQSKWIVIILIVWLFVIFIHSQQSYHEQTLIPWLKSMISIDDLIHWVPDITFRYDRIFVNSLVQPYEFIEFLIRKSAHLIQYSIFGLVIILLVKSRFLNAMFPLIITLIATFLIASLDELNQSFNPDRTGSLWDVALDTFGGLSGVVCLYIISWIWNRKKYKDVK